ncbi:MAG: peptidylprolyl isomerase [Ignavibacteriales bacterium]|nr:peptidylprolyl isomerase [Ignavibacteriales bacterium]
MGTMARMRNLAPWFIIGVGGIFVLFMVLSDSNVSQLVSGGEKYIGEINGTEITYQQFSALYENYKQTREEQTGTELDEGQLERLRDEVWDALVTQELLKQKIEDYNITVTDDEIIGIIMGPNPPEFLKQNFIDSTGQFNREMYDMAITDPRNQDILIQIEEQLKQQKLQEKLQSYLTATITVSEAEIRRAFIEQTLKMNAQFISVQVNMIPDSLIAVNDNDIQEYYDRHLEEYSVDEQRALRYILFNYGPSKKDSIAVVKDLTNVLNKLQSDTSTFKTYVEIYSDNPYKKDTLSVTQLHPASIKALRSTQVGGIVGPVVSYDGYAIYKLDRKLTSPDPFIKASHILISATSDDESFKKEADDIYNQLINGADFETLAKEKSADSYSGSKGGDLGWFGKGMMIEEFWQACLSAKVGEIQKPIKTMYGYHIIKVTERSNEKFIVEKITNKVKVSNRTYDSLYNSASDFSYLVQNETTFDEEAKLSNYEIVETPPFGKDAQGIPGLGTNKAIMNFTFENDLGSVSDVFRIPDGFVVIQISQVIEKGHQPLEQVKASIENIVKREKKIEKIKVIMNDIYSKVKQSGNLNDAKTIFKDAKIDTTSGFTLAGVIDGIGNEFAVAKYASNAELNKLSEPIHGFWGSYLIKVTKRSEIDEDLYKAQRNLMRDQLLMTKKQVYFSQWLESIKNEADIVDNRYLFFR